MTLNKNFFDTDLRKNFSLILWNEIDLFLVNSTYPYIEHVICSFDKLLESRLDDIYGVDKESKVF